mgnify:CR=1 FL=1
MSARGHSSGARFSLVQKRPSVIVALATPFDANGRVDLEALRAHVEFLCEEAVDALMPAGTTGEGALLDHEEVELLVAATVEASEGRANVLAHVGALRAWSGRPPVGIKLCIEGYEEIGSGALTAYPPNDPERFQADALVIGDMGSIRPGVPTLTTALRGMANVTLEVRTLASGKHSGQYGGAAPDALLAVLHALASLHDSNGDVAVADDHPRATR